MTVRENLKLLVFLVGAALFFAVTLLGSFFGVIVFINSAGLPRDQALNFFMVGLVPPSVATFVLFTKGLGRFM
ncbi:hypothetical protein [Nitrososphaera viennensis]|uniref:Uncharacterized protein n=2 Tax=Nitrososphaera viennensis TaxID=1034015 RepID=A0A060HN11_9ARCH|nr:hypothetical protein [Nitrososphaera viennensis]AIC16883.1 conserved exported protein of unknown function [Nitrososphaera viennensis EN76]UVS68786.1 hypothetical protein NWT39_12875 [Nitrososphaera viennensis]